MTLNVSKYFVKEEDKMKTQLNRLKYYCYPYQRLKYYYILY